MWVKMDWAKPRIIKGGYLLRSPEVTPEGFWCDPWVHVMPAQWRSGRSVARTVDLATHCPSPYRSKPKASTPFSNRMSLPNGRTSACIRTLRAQLGVLWVLEKAPGEPLPFESKVDDSNEGEVSCRCQCPFVPEAAMLTGPNIQVLGALSQELVPLVSGTIGGYSKSYNSGHLPLPGGPPAMHGCRVGRRVDPSKCRGPTLS